ncbi:MAG: Smr/MutS family protein [Pseudomonadota bacterium]|nr:Smr/MutS family protein [Pseudomonadota bacterium]
MARQDLPDEDRILFRAATADAAPLPPPATHHFRHPAPAARPAFRAADEAEALAEACSGRMEEFALPDHGRGDELVFARPGVQRRLLRRLGRGQYRIDGELDLHGLTVPQAHAQVNALLRQPGDHRPRVVRIVHGKGLRSRQGRPVIKPHLDRWLTHAEAVLAFCSAPPHDGGTGALYVLLRRHRRLK